MLSISTAFYSISTRGLIYRVFLLLFVVKEKKWAKKEVPLEFHCEFSIVGHFNIFLFLLLRTQ